ncbi:unnamed protein product [Arctogadus glacialis]
MKWVGSTTEVGGVKVTTTSLFDCGHGLYITRFIILQFIKLQCLDGRQQNKAAGTFLLAGREADVVELEIPVVFLIGKLSCHLHRGTILGCHRHGSIDPGHKESTSGGD